MKVAVLGCGPAGLVAAHAAQRLGARAVTVFSRRRKSQLFGSQYLHAPIPGVPGIERSEVVYRLDGTPEGYLRKIYGPDAVVNWTDAINDTRPAWDIRATYDWLWAQWWPLVVDLPLDAYTLSAVLNHHDLVISSIPSNWLCLRRNEHVFVASHIWAAGDAPERDIRVPIRCEENHIIRNGHPDVEWTRVSNTYGHVTVEWPDGPEAPYPTAARVPKPVSTTCDCWPRVVRVGRYGKWDKDGLVHDVYTDVANAINNSNVKESA